MSNINILLIFSLFLLVKQNDSLYKIQIDIVSQNYIPVIPIYFNEYPSIPKLLTLDLNSQESWIFNNNQENIGDNKYKIMIKRGFYMISGFKDKGNIYLNSDIKINDFNYLNVNQIYDEINNSGVLSLNKNSVSDNIIYYLNFRDDNIKKDKYFGFCLDFTNLKNNNPYLYIGDLSALNKDISKLSRFPLYVGDSDDEKNKLKKNWTIKLNGLFIGSVNQTNVNKNIYHLDKKKNKGLIIDDPATIETIYNYIYVTKEAMLFLISHYFNDKKGICMREDIKDENTYEIKYNCFKNKREQLNNINLILENNATIELTHEDLLNCAINKNIDSSKEDTDTCAFNIRYHNNLDYYVLGLPILRKYRAYFLPNDNSILIENNKDFSYNYLEENQFSSISKKNKRSIGQTLKELFNTTFWIAIIFALLTGGFYLYDKYYDNNEFGQKGETEQIINKNKYTNL